MASLLFSPSRSKSENVSFHWQLWLLLLPPTRRRGRRPLRPPSPAGLRNQRQPPNNFITSCAPEHFLPFVSLLVADPSARISLNRSHFHMYRSQLCSCTNKLRNQSRVAASDNLHHSYSLDLQLHNVPSYQLHHHTGYFRHSTAGEATRCFERIYA